MEKPVNDNDEKWPWYVWLFAVPFIALIHFLAWLSVGKLDEGDDQENGWD